jgi:hypothetical protein
VGTHGAYQNIIKILEDDCMLEFVAKTFRGLLSFVLWITLIGWIIGGGIIGYTFLHRPLYYAFDHASEAANFVSVFIGLAGGTLIGLITVILFGGLVANFLNMVNNIEKQEKYFKLILENKNIKIPDEFIAIRQMLESQMQRKEPGIGIRNNTDDSKLQDLQKSIKGKNINSKESIYENNTIKNKICNNCGQEVSINIDKCNNCGCNDFSQI